MTRVPMKASGLRWAERIPQHWDVARICLVARLESGHTPSRQHPEYWVPEECTIPWFSLADIWQLRPGIAEYAGDTAEKISPRGLANSAARVLPAGTVMLSRTASVGFSGIMPRPMATTQDFANWIPGHRVSSEYLLYALRAMTSEFERLRYGSTHQTIYMPDIRRLTMPVPPRSEQARIVAHLRERLATIDAVIGKKERFLALLAEKRHALVTNLVTKGLDRARSMRASHVAWIDCVPAHWDVVRVKHVARLESGHTPSRQHPEYWVPEECTIPWFSLADIWQLRPGTAEYLGDTAEKISALGAANSAARVLPAGTVVLSRTASVGFSGIMPRPMATTQDFANWVPSPAVTSEYLLYALRAMTSEFERVRYGSTHQTIYMPDIRRLVMPLPPRLEQEGIVAAIRHGIADLDRASTAAARSVEVLRQYRQALIISAITGQVDVSDSRGSIVFEERLAEAAQ